MALAYSTLERIDQTHKPSRRRLGSYGFEGTLRELSATRMRYEDLRRQGASLSERARLLGELHNLRARMAAYNHFV